MPQPFKLIALSLASLLITACSPYKLTALPTQPDDFRLPQAELRRKYPDINRYDRAMRPYFMEPAAAGELFEKWGEPHRKQPKWGHYGGTFATLGIVGALFWGPVPTLTATGAVLTVSPYPTVDYYWLKEKYCIRAELRTLLHTGYKPIMAHWTWYERENSSALPEECRENM